MVVDFQDAWNALAMSDTAEGRGNFLFARAGMGMLEFVSRLCSSDQSEEALRSLSTALERIEPRYFTPLPAPVARPGIYRGTVEWTLPHAAGSNPEAQLLWALFSVVRHGQAHQGQQCMAELVDGSTFGVSISGAERGLTIESARARRDRHLTIQRRESAHVLWLNLRPDVFFVDLQNAIGDARLLTRGLTFNYLERSFDFTSDDLWHALRSGGHEIWPSSHDDAAASNAQHEKA